jgi:hypothetical protein
LALYGAKDNPVSIETIDLAASKPVEYLEQAREAQLKKLGRMEDAQG